MDIVENIDRIESYVLGMALRDFRESGLVRDAVERCLERICEAAHRLGPRAVDIVPDQPWADIRGMGNRLRHGYDRIAVDVVWSTVRDRLPSLRRDVMATIDKLRD